MEDELKVEIPEGVELPDPTNSLSLKGELQPEEISYEEE